MKTLTEFINEETTNESMLGIAGGIVAGILGYKIVKGIINGLVYVGANRLINNLYTKNVEALENEWIPELERLLSEHPKSYEWAKSYWKKNNVEALLRRVNGTLGALTFVDEVLKQDDWNEADANRFKELWDKAFNTTKEMQKRISNNLLKTLS